MTWNSFFAICFGLSVGVLASAEGAVILGNAGDATWSVPRVNGTTYDAGTSGTGPVVLQNGSTVDNVLQVGGTSANSAIATAIIPFVLPTLNPGEIFTAVSFGIGQSSASNAQQFDLYGLARRASATVLASDYYRGPSGGDTTDATLIQSAFISTTDIFVANAVTSTNAAGGTALADYLNAQYASGAGAGQVVFLRMNVTENYTATNTRLSPHSVEAANSTLRPVINYTAAIPEPATLGFLTLCAAGVLLPRRRR